MGVLKIEFFDYTPLSLRQLTEGCEMLIFRTPLKKHQPIKNRLIFLKLLF